MNSMIAKSKKNITQKPICFIAPGQLAKDRVLGKQPSNAAHGSKRIEAVEQWKNNLSNRGMTGENLVHNLFVHYGEDKWEERNITEECSFLDVLSICSRFIDIYSFGIKITDGCGKPLRNDKDLMCLLKEQEDVENISVYLAKDATVQPLLFKLPEHNPSFGDLEDDNSDTGEMRYGNSRKSVEATEKVRKGRGPNKNKKIVALKKGEKFEIQFLNNRGVGPYHTYWSRHLGKIVRSSNICPTQVLTWKHMSKGDKEHMFLLAF